MASIVSNYQYTLDENGNQIDSAQTEPLAATPSEAATTYGYNAQKNRLLSAGSLSYAYDTEGQLANSGGAGLTFDYNHRLVAIAAAAQFSYDGRGNRLSATRAGVTTSYIYDPWGNLLADSDSTGVTHKYIHGKGLLAAVTSSGRYCYHFNATGSTVALTDVNQNIVNSYAYDPFGTVLNQQETVPQPFKYVGQYGVMAEPNRLYYMRARYYDPNVGRFISEDPLGFAGGDVNLYAYVQNNPINRKDPSGLIWVDNGNNYHIGWDVTNTLARWLLDELNNPNPSLPGFNPLFPGYSPDEYLGDRRDHIQEWQPDPNNPCRDKEWPIGTERTVPQVWSKIWLDPNEDVLVQDPSKPYYYQWYPWVNSPTYDDAPGAMYKFPWEK